MMSLSLNTKHLLQPNESHIKNITWKNLWDELPFGVRGGLVVYDQSFFLTKKASVLNYWTRLNEVRKSTSTYSLRFECSQEDIYENTKFYASVNFLHLAHTKPIEHENHHSGFVIFLFWSSRIWFCFISVQLEMFPSWALLLYTRWCYIMLVDGRNSLSNKTMDSSLKKTICPFVTIIMYPNYAIGWV
jgi:hypothetical protein